MDAFLEIAEELKLKGLADQTFTRSSSDVSEDEDKSTNLKPVRNAKKSWNQQPIIFTMLLYLWKSNKWDTEAHSSFTLPKCVERREGPRTYKTTLRKESQFRVIFVGRFLVEEPVTGSTKQNFINKYTAWFFGGLVIPSSSIQELTLDPTKWSPHFASTLSPEKQCQSCYS